ncbi:MAG: exodeoxyribonuclease VII large subunit, partial [Planctomycetota bacterium]
TLYIQEEISQPHQAASGHYYAALKDRDARISIVCWRSTALRLGARLPAEGEEVVAIGQLSVYGPRGQYQLVVKRFQTVGQGDLAAQFEALKARLLHEGLFAEEHKQALPFLPHGIGIATGADSAAEADILHSISTRFPSMLITQCPCLVQGAQAPESICASLQALDTDRDVAVIIVGRGGGSLEDLWAFNDERVVRAIAACRTPVVSAVGHETDITLADLVADVRAKTPTAAGELVVPVWDELQERLQELHDDLNRAVDTIAHHLENRLTSLSHHRALATPYHQLAMREQRLDELSSTLRKLGHHKPQHAEEHLQQLTQLLRRRHPSPALAAAGTHLSTQLRHLQRLATQRQQQLEQRFIAAIRQLEALSPLAVVRRGYAVLQDDSGAIVRSISQSHSGTLLHARLSDGILSARVVASTQRRLGEVNDLYTADTPPNQPEDRSHDS